MNNVLFLPGDRQQIMFACEHLPELWSPPGTCLYVGANHVRWHLGPELARAGHEITILEIWPPHVQLFRERCRETRHVVPGDVRTLPELPHPTYDVIVWWHGPEHIARAELAATLAGLEQITTRMLLLGTPWGPYPQGPTENPYEAHCWDCQPDDFAALGYQVAAIGTAGNHATGRLVAWKVRSA